ncbi:MAG: hypothetical protein IKE75_05770 [Bacilli bacterium]|nr:hypothetical protein [Bacilli bacterium]
MRNIINRVDNEFDFNYQKFVRNNNISKITSVKSNDVKNSFNNNNINQPVKVETMEFDIQEEPKEKEIEVLNLNG